MGWRERRLSAFISFHRERGGFVDSPFISFRERGGGDVELRSTGRGDTWHTEARRREPGKLARVMNETQNEGASLPCVCCTIFFFSISV